MTTLTHSWDAIIVAGGRGSRLGGLDKSALVLNGRTLLQRSFDAVRSAVRVCVVGFEAPLENSPGISHTVEHPRWAGPAAAIVAGTANLRDSDSEFTAVIAVDMPFVSEALTVLFRSLSRCGSADGLIAIDETGHQQPLLAVYRTASLRAAAEAMPSTTNLSVRALVAPLELHEVAVPHRLIADVDTPADAERLGIVLPILRAAG